MPWFSYGILTWYGDGLQLFPAPTLRHREVGRALNAKGRASIYTSRSVPLPHLSHMHVVFVGIRKRHPPHWRACQGLPSGQHTTGQKTPFSRLTASELAALSKGWVFSHQGPGYNFGGPWSKLSTSVAPSLFKKNKSSLFLSPKTTNHLRSKKHSHEKPWVWADFSQSLRDRVINS